MCSASFKICCSSYIKDEGETIIHVVIEAFCTAKGPHESAQTEGRLGPLRIVVPGLHHGQHMSFTYNAAGHECGML